MNLLLQMRNLTHLTSIWFFYWSCSDWKPFNWIYFGKAVGRTQYSEWVQNSSPTMKWIPILYSSLPLDWWGSNLSTNNSSWIQSTGSAHKWWYHSYKIVQITKNSVSFSIQQPYHSVHSWSIYLIWLQNCIHLFRKSK